LDEIIAHLESRHSLGLMTKLSHRNWHELIDVCRVEGRLPQNIHEFRALRAVAQFQEQRSHFAGRWRRAVESVGGPQLDSLGNSPERAAQGYAAEIRNRLDWRKTVWDPLMDELCAAGFRWKNWLAEDIPAPEDHREIARVLRARSQGLTAVVSARAALLRQAELSEALQSQRTYLAGFPDSYVALELLAAQDTWDVEDYETSYRELARLEGLYDAYNTFLELFDKLKTAA